MSGINTFVTTQHGNLLTKLTARAAGKPGLFARLAGFLAKGVKFLGPWGTALSVGVLALKGLKRLNNSHPAGPRV